MRSLNGTAIIVFNSFYKFFGDQEFKISGYISNDKNSNVTHESLQPVTIDCDEDDTQAFEPQVVQLF